MHVFMDTREVAAMLHVTPATVRKRIREGVITSVVANGGRGSGRRYIVDVTREFGIEPAKPTSKSSR